MVQRGGDIRSLNEHEQHLRAIREVVNAWQRGEISVTSKRGQIADLNSLYYGQATKGDAGSDICQSPRVVDEVLCALSDQTMVPVEAAGAALDALRRAGARASEADTPEQEAEIRAAGRAIYDDILRASR